MSRPTVISAVTHGKLNRYPRKVQPLPTAISAVTPTASSAVTYGSGCRAGSYSGSFKPFRFVLQSVDHGDTHGSRRLAPRTSVRLPRSEGQRQVKISKAYGLLADQDQKQKQHQDQAGVPL